MDSEMVFFFSIINLRMCVIMEWKSRMEIVEMVDCNGWPFWASCPGLSLVLFMHSLYTLKLSNL